MMSDEIWKDVKYYEGRYQVSNLGRMKSLSRQIFNGKVFYKSKERIMKCSSDKNGYLIVSLYKYDVYKKMRVSRVVATAFIPNPENKPQVNHINGIKNDNSVTNLEWCTNLENNKHARDTGLLNLKKEVIMISMDNEPLLIFDSQTEASIATGIERTSILGCCNKRKSFKSAGGYKWSFLN